MIRVRLETLHATATTRPPGYVDDVLQHAESVDDVFAYLTPIAYNDLCLRYREAKPFEEVTPPEPPPELLAYGAGTILLDLLVDIGITTSGGCPCRDKIYRMNRSGNDWCTENTDLIVSWMEAEAGVRGLPFRERFARLLVRRAIRRSRLAQAPLHG